MDDDIFGLEETDPQPVSDNDDPFGMDGDDDDNSMDMDDDDAADIDAGPPVQLDGGDAFGLGDDGADDPLGDVQATGKPLVDEDSPLAQWKVERAKVLDERIAEERKQKQALRAKAQEDIEAFYAKKEEELEKAQQANRNDEANAKSEQEALLANGTMWEKVAKLVNLAPRASEDHKTARLRKLLLQLKNEKPSE